MKQEQMTTQVKLYLSGASVRHLVMVTVLLLAPAAFNTPAFASLFGIFPRPFWLMAVLLEGLYLGYAAISRSEKHARVSLILASTLCLLFAVGALFVVSEGIGFVGVAILFFDLSYKDLVICLGPLRDPLAPLLRQFNEEQNQK